MVSISLSPALEQGIYRIAQEALENVMRHAEADRVNVRFVDQDDQFILTISDNGIGFAPQAMLDQSRR